MKISGKAPGVGQIQSKSLKKSERKKDAGGGFFTSALGGVDETEEASGVSGTAPTSALSSVGALLSLQEADTATEGRSKGLQRANHMMELLEEVRRGLLLGAIPVAHLKTLADLSRQQKGKSQDPNLETVLQDIELRAEVELAKLGY